MDIILSILILTHNRPHLFKRCLGSVINKPDNVEIIVNNDTSDIEIPDGVDVTVFYNKFNNLSKIYEFLFSQARGKYIWFLEDDDYAINGFYKVLKYLNDDRDIVTGFYVPCGEQFLKTRKLVKNLDFENFQLSQCIFKKDIFDFVGDENYCSGNCIHLDYIWFKRCGGMSKVFNSKMLFYIQTHDGCDNISFPEFTDLRKCESCELKDQIMSPV